MVIQPDGRPAVAGVQQVYELMMRDLVVPVLREMGFTGTRQMFRYRGSGEAWFKTQKDGRFTRQQLLSFTVNGSWWGFLRIVELMPQGVTDTWWRLDGLDADTAQVAGSFLAAIGRYVVPAMRAQLDEPDSARAAGVRWPRVFPPVPDLPRKQPDGGGAGPGQSYVVAAGSPLDAYFSEFASDVAFRRLRAAEYVAVTALGEPRTVEALLDRLEHDPSPWIRTAIAGRMLTLVAHDDRVRPALQAAAAEDEMADVRLAARYAIIADLGRSGTTSVPD